MGVSLFTFIQSLMNDLHKTLLHKQDTLETAHATKISKEVDCWSNAVPMKPNVETFTVAMRKDKTRKVHTAFHE